MSDDLLIRVLATFGFVAIFCMIMYGLFGYLLSPTYYSCESIEVGMAQSDAAQILANYKNNPDYEYYEGELHGDAKMGLYGQGILTVSHFADVRCGVIFDDQKVKDKQFYFD